MKLPKFFRRLTPISGIIVAIAMAARMISGNAELSWLSRVSEFVFYVSLLAFIVSFIGMLVVRDIANALIRRFGKSATATVRAVEGTNESVNRVGVYRVKLEVRPSGGEPFVAVAEDAIRIVNMVDPGDTVSVKYDPRTKEVALMMPKKVKIKRENF